MKLAARSLLLFLGLSLFSCQKGEDDPKFTLLTRTNRLAGEWMVTSYSFVSSDSSATLNGDSLVTTDADSLTSAKAFEWKFTFDKSGDYISQTTELNGPDATLDKLITTISGDWEFAGANNQKSKSQLVLIESEFKQSSGVEGSNIHVFTTSGNTTAHVYQIKELRDNKIVLTQNEVVSDPFSSLKTEVNLVLEPLAD